MKDVEKSFVGNLDSYATFRNKLEKLPENVVVIVSHSQMDGRKEKVIPLRYLFVVYGCLMYSPFAFCIFLKILSPRLIDARRR